MNEIFEEALGWYATQAQKQEGYRNRIDQLRGVLDCIGDDFSFAKVTCIETGASQNWADGGVGGFFAKACELSGGDFYSVDISDDIVNKSVEFYNKLGLDVNHYVKDSVGFLEETKVVPNLVHLDSWDLDLKNPFPGALHGWREFLAIEGKMPVGSVLIIDDNFFKGTWVTWNYLGGGSERIDINYPIVGKGGNVWHYVEGGESDWEKLSQDTVGGNVKLVYRKIK